MERSIDGNYTLQEAQSAINLAESHGHKLVSIKADDSVETPSNIAIFDDANEEVETKLIAVPPGPPKGTKKVCSGSVFICGGKKRVAAYR